MNKKIVHDALILFAFTIVLGLLLGVVYGVTKPSIDKVNEEKTQNAWHDGYYHTGDTAYFDEDAYLWYYGQQTAREQIIKLPPAHRYRVEALDTWNMTRETLQTGVSGRVVLTLPGREDMAVLAVRMD